MLSFRAPMLAKTYERGRVDVAGYWASEKLDGVRSVYVNGVFYSRTGKVLNVPTWFVEGMPKGVVLDGELYTMRRDFQRVMSIVTKHVPLEDEWKRITYMVFDVPSMSSHPWEERLVALERIVKDAGFKHLKRIPHVRIENEGHLDEMMTDFQRMQCEGIMLRSPRSPYEFKRSPHLLKYKQFQDADAIVIGHQYGTGKYANVLGKLIVQWKDEPHTQFHVGTGFTDHQRKEYQQLFPIHTIVKIKFFDIHQQTHKPRFPIFIGIRHSIDV